MKRLILIMLITTIAVAQEPQPTPDLTTHLGIRLAEGLEKRYSTLPRTSYEVQGLCNAMYHDCRTDLITLAREIKRLKEELVRLQNAKSISTPLPTE